MTMIKRKRGASFRGLQIPGWILLIYLIYAQGITAFGYDLGVAMWEIGDGLDKLDKRPGRLVI